MKDKINNSGYSSFIKTILERIPWFDILMGLFIPLNAMHILLYLKKPLWGIILSFLWCIIYSIIKKIITKKASTLGILTAFIILINFATSFLINHPVLYFIVEMFDNSLMGLAFLISLFTSTPLILAFVEKELLENIPEKVKKSRYYIRAWKIVTATWGISSVGMAVLITVLKLNHSPLLTTFDILSSWPLVIILFAFSVTFPKYYWASKVV